MQGRDWYWTIQPRWKEELWIGCPFGTIVLEHPMGAPTVVFPTSQTWTEIAPEWAEEYCSALRDAVENWCKTEGIRFEVAPDARVTFGPPPENFAG